MPRRWKPSAWSSGAAPYQTDAHALYRSLGFRRVPERDSSDEDGERLVFVKESG
ncbi:MAG TPA: hypothetical protein VHI77_10720 [Solirubrobacterales bacterium]|nr:hypothetical protein [Solirubrobacterales bacterium]